MSAYALARAGAAAAVLAALLASGPAHAAWIAEGIQVGLHADSTLDSAVTELVTSGAEVEVLERDGELIRIRSPQGIDGWVHAGYVVEDPPASVQLAAALDTAGTAQAQLEALESERAALEAERDSLATERDSLDAALVQAREARETAERERDAARLALAGAESEREAADRERSRLQAELDSAAASPSQGAAGLSQALRDVQRVAEENRALKQELAELEANQDMVARARGEGLTLTLAPAALAATDDAAAPSTAPPTSSSTSSEPSLIGFLHWHPWQWMLVGSSLLLAFGAGGYVVDLGVRRRHGGFRI